MSKKELFIEIIERKLKDCPEWLRPHLRVNLLRDFEERYQYEV